MSLDLIMTGLRVLLALSAAIGLGGPGAYAANVGYPLDLPYRALSYPESFVYTVAAAIVVVLAVTLVGRIGARPVRPVPTDVAEPRGHTSRGPRSSLSV